MEQIVLIGEQAMEIADLRREVADLHERMKNAKLHIICIGGPLNDNKLGYTKEQLYTFQRILSELE